jgi:hypothetical protein
MPLTDPSSSKQGTKTNIGHVAQSHRGGSGSLRSCCAIRTYVERLAKWYPKSTQKRNSSIGPVAQLSRIEQRFPKPKVTGSSPVGTAVHGFDLLADELEFLRAELAAEHKLDGHHDLSNSSASVACLSGVSVSRPTGQNLQFEGLH